MTSIQADMMKKKLQEDIMRALQDLGGKAMIKQIAEFLNTTQNRELTYRHIYDNLFPLFKEKYVRAYFDPNEPDDIFYINPARPFPFKDDDLPF